jgi:methanogenic corrinoid protein MtbC1
MSTVEIFKKMADVVVRYDDEKIDDVCREAISAGIDPQEAIMFGLAEGMRKVGLLYEAQEYGIPEVLLCSDVLARGMDILKPRATGKPEKMERRIVIGTVEGDIHSIGKNIVKLMLEVGGFEVIDLGEDVAPGRFIDEIQGKGGDIVALSTMMTTTLSSMRKIMEAVRGTFPDIKILVGGASVTRSTAEKFGASGYAENAVEAVRVANEIVQASP